jgi:hypothetical protein
VLAIRDKGQSKRLRRGPDWTKRMISGPSEQANLVTAIRLEINGDWSVQEFQALLTTIADVYKRVAAPIMLGSLVREERNRNDHSVSEDQMSLTWSNLYYEYPFTDYWRRQPLENAFEAVFPFVASLRIDGLKLESDGWAQIVGNLNPLKVIADFVSRWNSEKTKRMKIRSDERQREADRALERERIRQTFALNLMRYLPETDRHVAAQRLSEIAQYSIAPAILQLENLAESNRIGGAELVEPGTRLPPRRP